jgi:orotidine-5'-phosphate decarboxylase
MARAFEEFACRVVDVVAPLVAVVKPQMAFWEFCGPRGLTALQRVLRHARRRGLLSILDGKRNDIASTATAYAEAALGGVLLADRVHPVWDADALTVNPYLGRDAVEPFIQTARRTGRGVFVLVRTSNPGAGLFQDLVSDGRPQYLHVAAAVEAWTSENVGRCGLGDVGAVVGATHPRELAAVRQALPHAWMLLPGYGAQGATAADTAAAFREGGLGAIVNSARGILSAFSPEDPAWEARIEAATRAAVDELRGKTPMGRLAAP